MFTDEKNLTWEVWETKIQDKLKVNVRCCDEVTKLYTSINKLLKYLVSIYKD